LRFAQSAGLVLAVAMLRRASVTLTAALRVPLPASSPRAGIAPAAQW